MLQYIFVGERRSERAKQMGVRWSDGRLAAKTLFAVLSELHLEYEDDYCVLNAYVDKEPFDTLDHYNYHALERVKEAAKHNIVIIGMGRKAQHALLMHGIPHRELVHPAARGSIRGRQRYLAHVREVLRIGTTTGGDTA